VHPCTAAAPRLYAYGANVADGNVKVGGLKTTPICVAPSTPNVVASVIKPSIGGEDIDMHQACVDETVRSWSRASRETDGPMDTDTLSIPCPCTHYSCRPECIVFTQPHMCTISCDGHGITICSPLASVRGS
jgi:hypothetical protein